MGNTYATCMECGALAYGIYAVRRRIWVRDHDVDVAEQLRVEGVAWAVPRRPMTLDEQQVLCAPCGTSLPSKGYTRQGDQLVLVEQLGVESEPGTLNLRQKPPRIREEHRVWRDFPIERCVLLFQLRSPEEWDEALKMNQHEWQLQRVRKQQAPKSTPQHTPSRSTIRKDIPILSAPIPPGIAVPTRGP